MLKVSGERDMLYRQSEDAARLLPHAPFAALSGTGLDTADQQPEGFVKTVLELLKDACSD